jgi:hypothetical protein
MALWIPGDIMRGLDRPTFYKEKPLRLPAAAIKEMGEYLLRFRLDPAEANFAADFPVRVLSVIDSALNKRVQLEVRREPKTQRPDFRELFHDVFNNDGFITREGVDPDSDASESPGLITVGYLLDGTSTDSGGHDAFAYLKNPQCFAIEISKKELVTVA